MKFASKFVRLALAFCISFVTVQANADVIYNVNESFGGGTITGTVTTNGIMGVINNQNAFTDWNVTLSNGSISSSLNAANSYIFSLNFMFNASANTLTFNHDFGSFFLIIQNSHVGFWCLEGGNRGCAGYAGQSVFSIDNNGSRSTFINSGLNHSSVFESGNEVPEPGVLALMMLGLLAAAAVRKSR